MFRHLLRDFQLPTIFQVLCDSAARNVLQPISVMIPAATTRWPIIR
jgi:hypothetical protein